MENFDDIRKGIFSEGKDFHSLPRDRGPSYFSTGNVAAKRSGIPFKRVETYASPDDAYALQERKMRRRAFGTPGKESREQPQVDSFSTRFGNLPTPDMSSTNLYPKVLDLRGKARDPVGTSGSIPVEEAATLKENMTRIVSEFRQMEGRYNALVGTKEPFSADGQTTAGRDSFHNAATRVDLPTQTYYFSTPITDVGEMRSDSMKSDEMMETLDRIDTPEAKSELHLADDCLRSSRFTSRPGGKPLRAPRLDVVHVRRNERVPTGKDLNKAPREVGVRATISVCNFQDYLTFPS